MNRFTNRIVVVTGAARGIGQAIALRLKREGARLAVIDLEDLSHTISLCSPVAGDVLAIQGNVSDRRQIAEAVRRITLEWDRIDVWVNNAGIFDDTPLAQLSPERWQRVIDVNQTAVYLCIQAVAPIMLAQGWGRIINIASMAAKVPFPNEAAYCTSKAAVLGLTRALAVELGGQGITVNAICPGPIDTEMLRGTYQNLADQHGMTLDEWRKNILATIPVGRYGKPDDVAALVAFLASGEAGFINAQAINVDGGMVYY